MKRFLVCAAIALASTSVAQAQDAGYPAVHPVLGFGVTYGGDKLATAYYTNGTSYDIRAGSLLEVFGGVDVRLGPQFSMQGTIGYHFDRINASNGDLTFSRTPIELLGYYHVNDRFRLGVGLRYAMNPQLSGGGALSGGVNFDPKLGAIIEGEYRFSPRFGLKMRGVSEKYTVQGGSAEVDGSHLGVLGAFYF